jgi:hypothetical protein
MLFKVLLSPYLDAEVSGTNGCSCAKQFLPGTPNVPKGMDQKRFQPVRDKSPDPVQPVHWFAMAPGLTIQLYMLVVSLVYLSR